MSITLALLLIVPISSSFPILPFQQMLDSTQMVTIAKVDSMWTVMDTIPSRDNINPYDHIVVQKHVSARILSLYVKKDDIRLPTGSIHIIYSTETISPDGSVVETPFSPYYRLGVTFLSPLHESARFHSDTEPIYRPAMIWMYPVQNDSISLYYEKTRIPLTEAIDSLSVYFTKIEQP